MIYGNVSRGFKGGGYNGGFLFDPNEQKPYDPETVTAYELGFKSRFSNRVRLNGAFFYNNYKDMQIFTSVTGGGPVILQVLENAANATTMGGELEFTAVPTNGLEFMLGLSYLDTELKDYQTEGGNDLSGNQLTQAPKWSANGMLRYETPPGKSTRFNFQLDFSYQDKVFFSTDNQDILSQDAYTLLNARIGATLGKNSRWEVATFG